MTIDLAFDPKTNLTRTVQVQNRPDGFAITPDGDYAAVDSRGEIFIVPTDPEFGEKQQATTNSWRQRNQTFAPNGRWLAYTSDESKEEEIWIFDRETRANRKLTTHGSFKTIAGFSPDSSRLAWVGNNRLFITTVDSGTTVELGYNVAGGYTVTGWSPDGNWLVYTKRDRDQNADVFKVQ